ALQPGVWSPEIITPPTKIARIDVPYGQTVYVLFSGNSVPVKMTEGKPMNIGTVAKSVFRLYSGTGTMATVTVDKGS
ncbi:hypothetical protein M1432_03140, partial [Patescibacteria group bacterium]|nr:hypothetical protein [Patescibacteria group bacterium]